MRSTTYSYLSTVWPPRYQYFRALRHNNEHSITSTKKSGRVKHFASTVLTGSNEVALCLASSLPVLL